MSIVYNSIFQGAIAGSTAAYLQDRVNNEASARKTDTWTSVALQINHLLFLMAETMHAVSIPLGTFGTLARITYVLTPLVLLTSRNRQEITRREAKCAQQLSQFYRVGVIAASVATLVLGNPLFAMTSLSMLAIDTVVTGQAKAVFSQVKKTAAAITLVSYGAQSFAEKGITASLTQISTVVMIFKLFVLDLLPPVSEDNRASRDSPANHFPPEDIRSTPVPHQESPATAGTQTPTNQPGSSFSFRQENPSSTQFAAAQTPTTQSHPSFDCEQKNPPSTPVVVAQPQNSQGFKQRSLSPPPVRPQGLAQSRAVTPHTTTKSSAKKQPQLRPSAKAEPFVRSS